MKFHSKLKKGSLFLYSIIIQSWTEKECEFECNATHSFAYARCMNWNFFSKEFALFKLNYIFWMHWIFLSYYDLFLSFEWQRDAACIEVENFQFVERFDPIQLSIAYFVWVCCDFFLSSWWNVSAIIGTLFTLNQFNHLVYIPTFNRVFFFRNHLPIQTVWVTR